ncbi:type II toxin-antitoxin system RelE/ParE family toxin [Sandaracinobacteroides saxicola]|uniref:Type II toxin-antitoxin system RelE/ParE family toxin n=1 Tax=Sandaracinobacteroides saxicola TaxID=2759707 RepID=A0A7G5IH53_9SPHN|nr:type II toxin-antitoxin system RelE/ParE family toxin [Sandaracinobacteroides saxicola]QMW22695.1 type II toxin-antitoxin system RelE/ParE family toxin [Sandaracinobacteroides saxicola]
MYIIERTVVFDGWLDGLKDRTAQKRVAMRLTRIESGLLGDWKTLGDGISELRIDHGPGYRIYFTRRDQRIIILLCGSDKGDQDRAIRQARQMAKDLDIPLMTSPRPQRPGTTE